MSGRAWHGANGADGREAGKDCASKWKEEKATKNVKGREAYRKFMSGCLKG